MDISGTLQPKSEQLDAIELIDGPQVFTITNVSAGSVEQPVNVHLAEFPRPWRPAKNMRRVLAACWGKEASQWIGRRVELYFDPEVRFGKDKPGGTRIRSLSHINGETEVPVMISQGRYGKYKVKPLEDAPQQPTRDFMAEVDLATDSDELKVLWRAAGEHGALTDELKAAITARKDALTVDEGEQS